MANSYVQYTGNGQNYAVPFQYLSKTHVSATVDGTKVPFTWTSSNMIQLASDPGTAVVEVRRTTPNNTRLIDFTDGSVLASDDLDNSALQFLFLSQEAQDVANLAIKPSLDAQWDAGGRRIENASDPVDDQDLVTVAWAKTAQSAQLAQAIAAKNDAQSAAGSAAGSATAAAGSQSAAAGSQAAAKSSQDAAAGSASSAAGSASTATQKATAAGTSADAAKASENAADSHADDAAAAATAAQGSASSASASLTQALQAVTDARTQANASAASASNASTSEQHAADYAAQAAQSAANAASGGYTKSEVDTKLATKADASTTYTKTQVDSAVSNAVSPKANTSDVNTALADKLSKANGGIVPGKVKFSATDYGSTGMVDLTSSGLGAIQIGSKGTVQQSTASMEFLLEGRGGAYLGLDWDFTLKFGGGAYGGVAYRIFHQGNLNPIQGIRLANAGDKTGPNIEGMSNDQTGGTNSSLVIEPFAGAVMTGIAGNAAASNCFYAARWRYLQVLDQNGQWNTVSYA